MKKIFLLICALSVVMSAKSQTVTTNDLQKKFKDSFSLYFYKNTLKMLNQTDNKEFDEIIKNIEKMKFLIIEKGTSFDKPAYKKLVTSYKSEAYEEIMTMRYEGKNFDVYLRDKNGRTLGTVVLVNDSTSLYVLDILGSIDVGKATKLFSTISQSADVGKFLKPFMDKEEKDDEKKTKETAN